jgi:hypothetical protein
MKDSIKTGIKTGVGLAAAAVTFKAITNGVDAGVKKINNWRENRQREKQKQKQQDAELMNNIIFGEDE